MPVTTSVCPCRPRFLFKLLVFGVVLLAVTCFLHPSYPPLSDTHHHTPWHSAQKKQTKTRHAGFRYGAASEEEKEEENRYHGNGIHRRKHNPHKAVVAEAPHEKSVNKQNFRYNDEEDDTLNGGEIDIPQALRDELWPTKPPRKSGHTINRAILSTPQPLSSGQYKIYVDSIGQIGNQLFQFASVYGIARSMKWEPVLNPRFLLTALFSNITASSGTMPEKARIYMEDGAGVYSPSLYQRHADDFGVCCFLQSWRYFHAYGADIRAQLQFHEEIIASAQAILVKLTHEFIQQLKQNEPQSDMFNDLPVLRKQTKDYFHSVAPAAGKAASDKGFHATLIGVHVHASHHRRTRRGTAATQHESPSTPPPLSGLRDYYQQAMEYYRQRHRDALFLLVSDDQRWCRDNVSTAHGDVVFAGSNAASVDLALLSLSKHTVISAGAFGWWGGWLAHGDVLYPDWIPPPSSSHTSEPPAYKKRDLYPPWWLSINVHNATAD